MAAGNHREVYDARALMGMDDFKVANLGRTVMREEPVMIEPGRSDDFRVFGEYFRKSKFVLVDDGVGHKLVAAMAPDVRARESGVMSKDDLEMKGRTFEHYALMAATVDLYGQGLVNEADLRLMYPGSSPEALAQEVEFGLKWMRLTPAWMKRRPDSMEAGESKKRVEVAPLGGGGGDDEHHQQIPAVRRIGGGKKMVRLVTTCGVILAGVTACMIVAVELTATPTSTVVVPTEAPATRTPIRTPTAVTATRETALPDLSPTIPASETQTTSTEGERVQHNIEMFLNMPEQEYRDWVNQNAFIPDQTGNESTYVFPIDQNGYSLAERMGVKDCILGLVRDSRSSFEGVDFFTTTWQGVYLGSVEMDTRDGYKVLEAYFGVEIGGNRVVIPVIIGYENINTPSLSAPATIGYVGSVFERPNVEYELVDYHQLKQELLGQEGKILIFSLDNAGDDFLKILDDPEAPTNAAYLFDLYQNGAMEQNNVLRETFLEFYGSRRSLAEIVTRLPFIITDSTELDGQHSPESILVTFFELTFPTFGDSLLSK